MARKREDWIGCSFEDNKWIFSELTDAIGLMMDSLKEETPLTSIVAARWLWEIYEELDPSAPKPPVSAEPEAVRDIAWTLTRLTSKISNNRQLEKWLDKLGKIYEMTVDEMEGLGLEMEIVDVQI